MTEQTSDISPFAEHAWYEWVKFWDIRSLFLDPKEVSGRYLGPSLDIGPAMCAKMLKQNGQIVYLSTYRSLTQDNVDSPVKQQLQQTYNNAIQARLGDPVNPENLKDFDPQALTPMKMTSRGHTITLSTTTTTKSPPKRLTIMLAPK